MVVWIGGIFGIFGLISAQYSCNLGFCVESVLKSGVGCLIEVLDLRVVVPIAFVWFVGIGLANFQAELCPIFGWLHKIEDG